MWNSYLNVCSACMPYCVCSLRVFRISLLIGKLRSKCWFVQRRSIEVCILIREIASESTDGNVCSAHILYIRRNLSSLYHFGEVLMPKSHRDTSIAADKRVELEKHVTILIKFRMNMIKICNALVMRSYNYPFIAWLVVLFPHWNICHFFGINRELLDRLQQNLNQVTIHVVVRYTWHFFSRWTTLHIIHSWLTTGESAMEHEHTFDKYVK